ncbi:hypothetical protein [Mycoplasma sp. HS2188]|uniref:hypothetical protein n=1 Tax=Mycoplasma sp. HS2188 TaxID=2976765 RepID=UPI0021A9D1FB|nr:hypothetical protein [Mycoplasma sp. HS2188]MCT4469632.1 hypothetical protein [Mycoplasma sp. HS2188]
MKKKKTVLILTNTLAFSGGVITTAAVAACSIHRPVNNSNLKIENLKEANDKLRRQKSNEYNEYLAIAEKKYDAFNKNSESISEEQKNEYKQNALKNIKALKEEFKNDDKTELEKLKNKIQKIKIEGKKINVAPTEDFFDKNVGKLPDVKPSLLYFAGAFDSLGSNLVQKVNSALVDDFNLDLSEKSAVDFLYKTGELLSKTTDSGLYNYNSIYNGKIAIKEPVQWLLDSYENERISQNLDEIDYYVKPLVELINNINPFKNSDFDGFPRDYLNFIVSKENEHKVLFTPHGKVFLKRLYLSLKNYNYDREIGKDAWRFITTYLRWNVWVNGYKFWGPYEMKEFAYSLFLSDPKKTDLVERFKDVYRQLKDKFWNVKPFVIDTESDQYSSYRYGAVSEHILDGKNGIASKYPNRDDVQNHDTQYLPYYISTISSHYEHMSDNRKLYSYAKNSGLEYVRLQLGTAELAKIKNNVIQNRYDYEKKDSHGYLIEMKTPVNKKEKEEVFKQTFFYPSLLPDIQVGYIDPGTNKEIYFDGVIQNGMSEGKIVPANATPLYLKNVISRYLNEKWDKYQSLMPPYVPFRSNLRRLTSERYDRFRLALATLELDFDQSEYTLADLLGSSVKPDTDKVGLYNEIFLEHVGQYQEQDQWGTYSIPKNSFELDYSHDGIIDYYPEHYGGRSKKTMTDAMFGMIYFFEDKVEYNFKKDNLRIHPDWFTLKGLNEAPIDVSSIPYDYFVYFLINDGEGEEEFNKLVIEKYLTPPFSENEEELKLIKSKLNTYLETKKNDFKQRTGIEYNFDNWAKVQLVDLYTNPNNKELIYSHLKENEDFSENIIARIFDVSFQKQIEFIEQQISN